MLLYHRWARLAASFPPPRTPCLVELHDQEARHLGSDPWYCCSLLTGPGGGWVLRSGRILDSHPEDQWVPARVEP